MTFQPCVVSLYDTLNQLETFDKKGFRVRWEGGGTSDGETYQTKYKSRVHTSTRTHKGPHANHTPYTLRTDVERDCLSLSLVSLGSLFLFPQRVRVRRRRAGC